MKAGSENYTIQTVSLALDLLEQFHEGDDELSISDLSKRLKIHTNNAFRLVATLTEKNYLEKNSATDKYRLGIMTLLLSQVATRQIDFAIHVHPFLVELKRSCNETCYYSVIRDGYTYFLDCVESDLPVRVVHRLGYSRPLYCTAAGRVQLAFMNPQKTHSLLSKTIFNRLTAHTITDPELLRNELNVVAQKGYAIEDQEHDAGVIEIAAPVFDSNGLIIGVLSILGPKMRLSDTRIKTELIPLVRQSALQLSSVLEGSRYNRAFGESSLYAAKYKRKSSRIEMLTHPYAGKNLSI